MHAGSWFLLRVQNDSDGSNRIDARHQQEVKAGKQAVLLFLGTHLYLGCLQKVLPTLGCLLPSANPWECPHRPSQRLVSYLIPDPVKLTRLTITANTIKCFDNVNDNQTLKVMKVSQKCATHLEKKYHSPLGGENLDHLYSGMASYI